MMVCGVIRKALLVTCIALTGTLLRPLEVRADQPYQVRIVFIGLMTFKLESGSATVLIPNVSRGRTGEGDYPHSVDPHEVYILAEQGSFVLNQDFVFKRPPIGQGYYKYQYITVDGELVAIDDANQVADLNGHLTYSRDADQDTCPDALTRNSTHWLSSIMNVTANPHNPDTAHFDPRPSESTIIARISPRYGHLDAHVITGAYESDFKVDGQQQPGPTVLTQAVAQEVHWTFTAAGDPFVLNLQRFDSHNIRPLMFKAPPSGGTLQIVIGSTMPTDVGALIQALPAPKDPHYSVYYEFIAGNTTGLGPIPFRGAKRCDTHFTDGPALSLSAAEVAREPRQNAAPGGLNCGPDNWP